MPGNDAQCTRRRRALWPLAALVVAGCAAAMRPPPPAAGEPVLPYPLFAASDALMKSWRFIRIWGQSEWRLIADGDDVAIEPVVDGSSTALARWVQIDTETCPVVEWSWRVDRLPEGADLAVRATDDVAASLVFAFGDPGALSNPRPVPTLRYVWSTPANAAGSVIESPYFIGTLYSFVVRSGGAGEGWHTERRNLREDYQRAFGEAPPGPVEVMALFTDNDHLEAPLHSLYRAATLYCTELPDEAFPS
ncbi:DUF3047 domain-containing protein [Limibaculum sp. FT325]|uniref:DUF3047 domain-containing protein n=1 Tax=Thermohalobaculum sediminis TaxID=2939436 RepID=UPI0020BD9FBA|nr:DUF3047 domain-containing protein [Limibaculum sediminis]MCL5775651.1 DUF3047 domain-containing protein [Limibaculum sediminis]